jgi:putative endonuclease
MELFTVYILFSSSHTKTYVGYTNDLERRLWEHNNHPQKSFTSKYRPWVVIHTEEFQSKKSAMTREKWFKTGVGREYKNLIISQYLTDK